LPAREKSLDALQAQVAQSADLLGARTTLCNGRDRNRVKVEALFDGGEVAAVPDLEQVEEATDST
jgi:hypothetical protein